METVIIVIHLMVVVALVAVVLLQRSEGGALGMGGGGGGGGGGFMSARGAANALTRTTGFLAAAFFITSLSLGVLAKYNSESGSVLDRIPAATEESGGGSGILDQLRPEGAPTTSGEPQVPTSQ